MNVMERDIIHTFTKRLVIASFSDLIIGVFNDEYSKMCERAKENLLGYTIQCGKIDEIKTTQEIFESQIRRTMLKMSTILHDYVMRQCCQIYKHKRTDLILKMN